MIIISISFIVLILSVCNGLKTTRKDGDVIHRDFPISLPNTGFMSAKSSLDTVMLKIIRKVNSPGFCSVIEIINQPVPNSSPFVGGSEFSLITDQLFNEHYAWSNGVETLSYIPIEGKDYGNWLIGNTPGVDNGYVYISTNMPSLTPINLENDDNIDYQWKWLLNMSWKEQPKMRAICKDIYKPGNIYYEIEYFDHITRQAVKSAFVPDLNPIILSLHNQLNHRFDPIKFLSKESNILIPFPSYFEISTQTWKLLDGITVIAEYGSPILITRKKEQTGIEESHIGILVNEEHSGKFGWRLSFRNYPFSHMRNKEKEIILKAKTTQTLVFDQLNITNIDYKPFKSTLQATELTSLSSNSILLKQSYKHQVEEVEENNEYLFEEEEEYTIEIDNNGCLDDYQLLPLPNTIKKNVQRSIQYSLETIRPGDYVWLWYTSIHPEPGNSSSSNMDIDIDGNTETTSTTASRTLSLTERSKYYNNWYTNEVSELLVRCKSRNNNTLIFQYYLTDRRDVMKQTQLERDIDYFTIQLPSTTTTTESGKNKQQLQQPIVQFQNSFVQIKSLLVLGNDILNYLRRFLLYKEGRIHGLSSCYMYHAAVSMPQALIYAAEILCVLLGSKPVAMIQYTTKSEHQWKFPLVHELVRGIVVAKLQLGPALDLSYETFQYQQDETLLIYRTGKRYLVDNLLPYKQAQALHPVPYPSETQLEEDWKKQIYNSAWNGFILGYPGFFVESYCESFHNGLSLEEKRRQLALAEYHFHEKMQKNRYPKPLIKLGSDVPITPIQYELIRNIG